MRKFVDLNLIWEERFADRESVVAVHDLILEYCIEEAGHLPQLHNIYLSRGINVARLPANFFIGCIIN